MMPYIKRFLFFLLVMMVIPFRSSASEPIVIGVPLPLSGKQMEDGRMMKDSFEMARNTINENGGINGRPLHLVYADDQGKESIGEKIIKDLVNNAKAVMLVGGHTSAPTYAMAKVANTAGCAVPRLYGLGGQDHPKKMEEHLPAESSGQRVYQGSGRFLDEELQAQIHVHYF